MKPLGLAFAAPLVLAFTGFAHAACVSGPANNGIDIYSEPVPNGPVIGGISEGICEVEVSDQCSGGFCHVFFGTLSGWADMRYVSVPADEPPVTSFVYEVTGGRGSVSFLGQEMPTLVEKGGKIVFKPNGGDMILTLPPVFQEPQLRMQRIGSGSFSGTLSSWGGFPIKVEVIAERVSDQRATLEFLGQTAQIKMDIFVELGRTNKPRFSQNAGNQTTNNQPVQPSPAPLPSPQTPQDQTAATSDTCLLADDVAAAVGAYDRPDLERIFTRMQRNAGISDFRFKTEEQCRALLDDAARSGLLAELDRTNALPPGFSWGPVTVTNQTPGRDTTSEGKQSEQDRTQSADTSPSNGGNSGSPSACDALAQAIGPILRTERGSTERAGLMGVLQQVGVFDVTNARPGECLQIGIDLERLGLIPSGTLEVIRVGANAQDGLGGPDPHQGGEDPATMIEGGVEIPGSEADFAPADPSNGGQETAITREPVITPPANGQSLSAACIALADQVFGVLNRKDPNQVRQMQDALFSAFIETLSSANSRQCEAAITQMRTLGLLR
ncbi:MAG: hypothetical protein AAGE89_01790 [Pseudomonadota bacterium]